MVASRVTLPIAHLREVGYSHPRLLYRQRRHAPGCPGSFGAARGTRTPARTGLQPAALLLSYSGIGLVSQGAHEDDDSDHDDEDDEGSLDTHAMSFLW